MSLLNILVQIQDSPLIMVQQISKAVVQPHSILNLNIDHILLKLILNKNNELNGMLHSPKYVKLFLHFFLPINPSFIRLFLSQKE